MSIKEAGDLEASLIDGSVSAVVRSGDITMDIEQVCGHKPILFSDAFGSRLGSKSFPVYFSQSQIGVKKFLFTNTPSRFASAVFDGVHCPGTSSPRVTHPMVSLFLCSSESNAQGPSMALEGRHVSSKSFSMF